MADCLVCKKRIGPDDMCYEIRYGGLSENSYHSPTYGKRVFTEFFPDSDLGYVHEKCLNIPAWEKQDDQIREG